MSGLARFASAPAEAFASARVPSAAQTAPLPVSLTSRDACHFNPQPVSLLAALALSRPYSAALCSSLRFRLEKYATAYFFDRNRTSKKLRQLTKPRLSAAAHYNQLTKSTNMSTALNNHSVRSTVSGTVAISDDELRRFSPSVFASQPIEGVSERYRFLPTSSILNGMRENGWVPVRAQEQSIRTEARRGFQKHSGPVCLG